MSGIDSKIAENILRELKRLNETNEKVLNVFQKSQDLSRKNYESNKQNYNELKESNKRGRSSNTKTDNEDKSSRRPNYQNPFEGLDDFKETVKELTKFNAGLRLISAGFGMLNKGADLLITPFKLFGDGLDKVGEMFKNLNSQGYQNLTSIVGYGGVMGTLAQIVDDTTDNYKKMMQQGQLFGGSMLDLSLESAQSRLGLRQFTEMVENSGVSIGVLTLKRFSDLQNSVRSASREFGQFGYTTEQMIEVINEDVEARRISGTLGSMTNDQLRDSQLDLMKQTQSLSGITGKSMEEIRKQTNEIRKNPLFAGFISSLGKNGQQVEQGFNSALNIFSALPGNAGNMLGEMLSQGAAFNNVFLSDSGRELGGFISNQMQSLNRVLTGVRTGSDKVEEYTLDTVESFQNLGKDQGRMRQLSVMASAGDDRAKKVLELVQNVSGVNVDALRKKLNQDKKDKAQQERLKPFTNIMSNFIDTGSRIFGAAREFFIKTIGSFLDGLEQSGALSNLEKFFEQIVKTFDSSDTGIVGITKSLGNAVGNLLNGLLSKENLDNLQLGLMKSLDSFKKIFEIDNNDQRTFMEKIGDGIADAVSSLSKYLQDSGITATISDLFTKILIPVSETILDSIKTYLSYQIDKFLNPSKYKDMSYGDYKKAKQEEEINEQKNKVTQKAIQDSAAIRTSNENDFTDLNNKIINNLTTGGNYKNKPIADDYKKEIKTRLDNIANDPTRLALEEKLKNDPNGLSIKEASQLGEFATEFRKLNGIYNMINKAEDISTNKNLSPRDIKQQLSALAKDKTDYDIVSNMTNQLENLMIASNLNDLEENKKKNSNNNNEERTKNKDKIDTSVDRNKSNQTEQLKISEDSQLDTKQFAKNMDDRRNIIISDSIVPLESKKSVLNIPKPKEENISDNKQQPNSNNTLSKDYTSPTNINNQATQTNIDISSLNDIMSRVLFTLQSIDNSLKRES